MKTLLSTVAALAVATAVMSVATARANPLKKFARSAGAERDSGTLGSAAVKKATPADKPTAPVPAGYPRYRLIDLGTFGGPNSGVFGVSVQLNNRGEAIAQLETAIPDPYSVCVGGDECLVYHGAVRDLAGAIKDLGALPGTNASVPVGISETGLIAGLSQNGVVDPLTSFPIFRAVMWDQNRNIWDLGTLGGIGSAAYSVNARGQVVGVASNTIPENPDVAQFVSIDFPAATQVRAFIWQNGAMRDLGTLGGNDASATLINNRGQVVGVSYTNTTPNDTTGLPTLHPFLYENGTMRDLGSLGGTISMPGSITLGGGTRVMNDNGDVAGTSMLAGDEVWHAFYWSKGAMVDLGTLGGSTSDAVAISNKGQVIGRAKVTDTPFVRHAFLWEKGSMTDLGAVAPCMRSTATGINSANQIVGSLGYCTDNPDDLTFFSAFYVESGKPMVDLNTLVTPQSPIQLRDAWNINERGEIFANGRMPDGSERAVLLVPISAK